jgi:copper chaperone CopZ
MKTIKLKVMDMKCMGCVNTVQNVLSKIKGINDIKVDLETKRAIITAEDSLKAEDLIDAINKNTNYKAQLEK